MKVSYKWLEELVDLNDISKEQFLHDLSLYSIEIDGVEPLAHGNNLVVGKVLEKEKHPNADKLSVCKVDVGTEVLQIVCGAPNCTALKKVIVALPGAVLPGGEIKESKIRGIESYGMLCSLQELGIENKDILDDSNIIFDLNANSIEYISIICEINKEYKIDLKFDTEACLNTPKELAKRVVSLL